MKIKIIKLFAIIILSFSLLRVFANIFFGIINFKLFFHVFADILWTIASIGVLKVQNWGRILMLSLSILCIFLFVGYIASSIFNGHDIDIAPNYLQGFVIAILWVISLSLKSVRGYFFKQN